VGEPITKEIRTFANREEGQGWAHDIWPGPEAYTDPQRAAIRDYTGSGYRSVNRALRESAGKKGKLQALDNAMTRAPRVPEPVQVARGLDTTWAYAMNGGSLNLTEMVGREYTEHGYMSTSVSNRGALGGSVSILMDVPAGSKALYVSGKVGDSASTTLSAQGSYEAEMLFPRGSRYRIDSAVPSGTGNWVLHATLLP